jgi:hypothetical protein
MDHGLPRPVTTGWAVQAWVRAAAGARVCPANAGGYWVLAWP